MSTAEKYSIPTEMRTWDIPMAGEARFTWEYDDHRDRLLSLYQKGKDKQWDAQKRIDWSLEVDPYNALGLPEGMVPIHELDCYQKMNQAERDQVALHMQSWQFSQFLHGEQGAMICSARIVEGVPDLDAKFYAATQTMDEARHAETYARFLQEKLGLVYPINPYLKALLENTLNDSRWDMPYLGMQVLIEGLALAAFGIFRDMATTPLPKQILAYVMQDEARHVAFGRIALRDYYSQLTDAERSEREDFVVEGCYLMRDRLRAQEVWETLDLPVAECIEATDRSPIMQSFRSMLFSRIVPCVKDIGLWGDKVQKAYADMGVLDMAGVDLDALMKNDEDTAEALDRFRAEEQVRVDEIEAVIKVGADA